MASGFDSEALARKTFLITLAFCLSFAAAVFFFVLL